MRVLSVNVGQREEVLIGDKPKTTGIVKKPVTGAVRVTHLGLTGDHIVATKHHGGPDQAVYLYSREDYDWWAEQLGEPLAPGTFGENVTLDLAGPEVRVGDRYKVGGVLLEVTAPRIPCDTFAARMGDPAFVKKFREARRPGFYTRVLEEGGVEAGDPVERWAVQEEWPTVLELFEVFYDKRPSAEYLRRLLSAPVAERARADYEGQLAKL